MDQSLANARDIPGQEASQRRLRQQESQLFTSNQGQMFNSNGFEHSTFPPYSSALPMDTSKDFQELEHLIASTTWPAPMANSPVTDVETFEMDMGDGFSTSFGSFPPRSFLTGPGGLSVSTALPARNRASVDPSFPLSRTNSTMSYNSNGLPLEDTYSVTSGGGSSGGFPEDSFSPLSTSAEAADSAFSPANFSANSSFIGTRFHGNSFPNFNTLVPPTPTRSRASVSSFSPHSSSMRMGSQSRNVQRPSVVRHQMRSSALSGSVRPQETRQSQSLALDDYLQDFGETAEASYPEIGDHTNSRMPSVRSPIYHSDIFGRISTPHNLNLTNSLEAPYDPWAGTDLSENSSLPDFSWLTDVPFNYQVSPPSREPTPATHNRALGLTPGQAYLAPPSTRRQHSQSDPPPVSPSIISGVTISDTQSPSTSTMSTSSSSTIVTRRGALAVSPRRPSRVNAVLEPDSSQMVAATRGKRRGPLRPEAKVGAKKARNDRSVCIRCKHSRQTCMREDGDFDGVCIACQKLNESSPWVGICTKAYFYDMVQEGTLNYISQRAINHQLPNSTQRVRIELDSVFNIDATIAALDNAANSFNIRVEQGGKSAYVIDLRRTRDYLASVKQQLRAGVRDLRSFIDQDILKVKGWKNCLVGDDPMQEPLTSLLLWTCMPSRATYWIVPVSQPDARGRPLDPIGADRETVKLAGQLSRMLCRKLEVEAYNHLQKLINDGLKDRDILPFLQRLGEILATLRWRVSWWGVLGGGQPGQAVDPEKEQFEFRVNQLCRILYFYYCAYKRKLPSWSDTQALKGVYSHYADTAQGIFDTFPDDESIEGFEVWLLEGRSLIDQAGVRETIRTIAVAV